MVVVRKERVALAKKSARLLERSSVTEKLELGDERVAAIDGLRTSSTRRCTGTPGSPEPATAA